MHVVCTVVILLSPTYRDVVSLHGVVVKERGDYIMVDFSREFDQRHYSTAYQSMVLKLNENACLYEEP